MHNASRRIPRSSNAPLLALLLLFTTPSCTNTATSEISEGSGLGLGQEAFEPDAVATDSSGDVDATDAADDVPDGAASGEACSLLNGGCRPALKCVVGVDGAGICVPAGVVGEGEPCGAAGVDDCADQLFCFDTGAESGEGFRCRRFCNAITGDGCVGETTCTGDLGIAREFVGICL